MKKRKKEKEKQVTLPTDPICPNDFSHVVSLPVSLSKSFQQKPFTLLKIMLCVRCQFLVKAIVFFELKKAISFSILFTFRIIHI